MGMVKGWLNAQRIEKLRYKSGQFRDLSSIKHVIYQYINLKEAQCSNSTTGDENVHTPQTADQRTTKQTFNLLNSHCKTSSV